jgi:hypothetical protein
LGEGGRLEVGVAETGGDAVGWWDGLGLWDVRC